MIATIATIIEMELRSISAIIVATITEKWFPYDYTCSVFTPFFSVEFLVELDVTSTGLFSICAWFLFPVLLC